MLAGRDFTESDLPNSPRVAIVNETFAKEFFGGAHPVGKVIYDSGKPNQTYQIVGLVKDMKYHQLREDFKPITFVAISQEKEPGEGQTFVIRSNEARSSTWPG